MKFVIGTTTDPASTPIECDLEVLMGSRALVQANSGAGKSWCLRRILEETQGHVQQIVIDLEGEFISLREKGDYVLAAKEGGDTAIHPRTAKLLAHRLLELRASAILDLSEVDAGERLKFVRYFVQAMVDARRDLWHSVLLVLDEAQFFVPEKGNAESAPAVMNLAMRGRKRGFCLVVATQRLAETAKTLTSQMNNKLIGRCLDVDARRAAEELGFATRDDRTSLRRLPPGHFFAFGPALSTPEVVSLKVGGVETTHPEAGQRVAFKAPPRTAAIAKLLPSLEDLPAEAEREHDQVEAMKKEVRDLKAEKVGLELARDTQTVACTHDIEAMTKEWQDRIAAIAGQVANMHDLVEGLNTVLDRHHDEEEASRGRHHDDVATWFKAATSGLGSVDMRINEALGPQSKAGSKRAHVRTSTDLPRSHLRMKTVKESRRPAGENYPGSGDVLEGLKSGARKILHALAVRHPLYWTKAQVATLTQFTVSGGTFQTYIGELRRRDLITVEGRDVRVTETGLAACDIVEEAPETHEEMMEMWSRKLKAGCYRMLQAVATVKAQGAEGITKSDLAADVGMEVTGGSFQTYLSTLRRNGLIVVDGGLVEPSAILYPEAA